jgi:hypothetical protein
MSIKDVLAQHRVLEHVVLPPSIDALLSALDPTVSPGAPGADGIIEGNVKLVEDLSKSPIPGFDFALALPTGVVAPAPFKLKLAPSATPSSFKFWLVLASQGQVHLGFKFIEGIPGLALTGAKIVNNPDGSVVLEPVAGSVPMLVSRAEDPAQLGPALLVSGSESTPASIRFTPDTSDIDNVVVLGLEPPAVVFGSSRIGFHCPNITIDDSDVAKAPGNGVPGIVPPKPSIDADVPSWRGILARELDFYLPGSVPFFGGQAIKGYLAIPRGDGGVSLLVETKVPARPASPTQPARPEFAIRIECMDPTAKGLSGFVPTLISASMNLPPGLEAPLGGGGGGGPISFASGTPVRITATLARNPVNDPGSMRLAIAVAAQGPKGIVSVVTGPGTQPISPPKVFNTAAAMATALIADQNIPRDSAVGDGMGVVLSALAAAGAVLSSLFQPESEFVLNGVEIETGGHGLPVGGKMVLSLDYSVALRVTKLGIPGGALSVEMNKDQPMRIRVRRVRMSLDPSETGLAMFALDYDRAELEIENPGAWDITGLKQLFDVVGSRSGRGSSWIEVDLRFKLNLGPIEVSGVTIRATLNGGMPEVSLRGIEARLLIPGAIDGKGRLHLLSGGFEASMGASIIPLKVTADAGIIYAPPMIVLRLAVDLPAPIPLANSGLGLLGIGGLFGIAAEPRYQSGAESDSVLRQLQWKPDNVTSFSSRPGQSTFGLEAAVGTLPDLGFTFSAKAGVLITVPDLAVRGSLNGRVLQPAVKMSDASYPPSMGISFLGFIGVDSEAVSFAVMGSVDLKPLLEIKVPVAGHYPYTPGDDWYTYIGADGYPGEGRKIGPISAKVLPDILGIGAEAYFMARGRGITAWPHNRALPGAPITLSDGFVIAFGFALQTAFGLKPIAWAELYASLDLLVGAKPTTLAGFGRAGGSLNLGPFSIGVQAQVTFFAQGANRYFWAQVTGRIELLFFDVEGTVTIAFGTSGVPKLPPPDRHPLDRIDRNGMRIGSTAVLTDDSYRVLAQLSESPDQVTDDKRVWPDAMIALPLAITPAIGPDAGLQFPGVLGPGATPPAKTIGTEMLSYHWRLDGVTLVDVTDEADKVNGAGFLPAAELSSRWQAPRSGAGDVSELLLFSISGDLWVNRRPDGAKELPHDPLGQNADICHRRPLAEPGWAIGHLAAMEDSGFRLPPDPISVNPLKSRVEAHMHHFALTPSWKTVPLDNVFTLPEPFSLWSASIDSFDNVLDVAVERKFYGELIAPNLRWLAGQPIGELIETGPFAAQRIELALDEPIIRGLLLLTGDERIFLNEERFFGVIVEDDLERWIPEERFGLAAGRVAVSFRQQSSQPIGLIRVSWPLSEPLGVIGLRGITQAARDAAAAEITAIGDLIDILSKAKADKVKTDPLIFNKHQRAILRPGRLYRLDIDMSWSGELYKQDDKGSRSLVTSVADQTTYAAGGGGTITTNRKLFFGTTPKPVSAATLLSGEPNYATWLHHRQDVFQPQMIERYLGGYEPGQSEEFRFRNDPIRAHFTQNHVPALAKAYGFKLKVAIRRIDRPLTDNPDPIDPAWSAAINPKFLGIADQFRYADAITSACALPLPGATATVDSLELGPETWYEVYVLASSMSAGFADGRLPGVTFRTSRWTTPETMLAGLGFTGAAVAAETPVVGDLAVATTTLPGGLVVDDDDQAFQHALAALGLEGWPVAQAPRLSRLWIADQAGAWRFAGLMIESPEPIHRPGRLELAGPSLTLEMTWAGSVPTFAIRRRDRSGSRLIYMTATPFEVSLPPDAASLVLKATSRRGGPNTPGVAVIGRLSLPPFPGFAEDP